MNVKRFWLPAAFATLAISHPTTAAPRKAPDSRWQPDAPSGPAARKALVETDQCLSVPGYREFREDFEAAIDRRDARLLADLFLPKGSISVEGIRGVARDRLATLTSEQAEALWPVLAEIKGLGCARHRERLFLPGISVLVFQMHPPENSIALRSTVVRKSADGDSRIVGRLSPGASIRVLRHDNPAGWTQVYFRKKEAFVPTRDLRSAYSYQLELRDTPDGWRIDEFGTGV